MVVRPGLLIRKNAHYMYQIMKCSLQFFFNFYRCTVRFDIYKVHTPTNALFIKLDKVLKFTLKITLTYITKVMFRSKFGKNYVVICYAVVWQHAATPPHNL